MYKLLKLRRLAIVAAFVAAGAVAPTAEAAYVINFDSLGAGSNANLDPIAQANGITFASGQLAADLDASGYEILDSNGQFVPGFTHWEAIPGATITVVDSSSVGRGMAPSPANAVDGRFDQVLMSFGAPTLLNSVSFALDTSTYGDLQARSILLLDANGKTLRDSTPFAMHNTLNFGFNFAPTMVSGVLLPASKLYDNIGISAVPEPSTWILSLSGLAMLGLNARRRRAG